MIGIAGDGTRREARLPSRGTWPVGAGAIGGLAAVGEDDQLGKQSSRERFPTPPR